MSAIVAPKVGDEYQWHSTALRVVRVWKHAVKMCAYLEGEWTMTFYEWKKARRAPSLKWIGSGRT